jgi:hypothetical protein
MDDIHCFEVSGVFELANELGARWHDLLLDDDGKVYVNDVPPETKLAFLPAPKTWIEFVGRPNEGKGYRCALLLEEAGNDLFLVTMADGEPGWLRSFKEPMVMPSYKRADFSLHWFQNCPMSRAWQITTQLRIFALLALINSPKVIGRVQHMPHRRLVKAFAGGSFPLHAWTEIKLDVAKPLGIDDGEPHEARLTGRRALHFCRAHIRIRLGLLEYVSAHWRGDPSIGIKQSRYVVEARASR